MSTRLDNRIALVTGASRGIGAAIARTLAANGASLVLTARSKDRLIQVRDEIVAAGGQAVVLPADLAQEDEIQRVFGSLQRLDILVNCAGIGVFGPLAEATSADWDRVMTINVRTPFLCCREALRLMVPQHSGTIINIASVVAVKGYVNQGIYSASKHALLGMTKVLAQEVLPAGVRVQIVCPGGVDTGMASQARPDLDRSGLIRPEEVAEVVLMLAAQRGNAVIDQVNIRRAGGTPWFSE
ncbi:MAG: SDR family oxidoreductase [Chloroflexi bacterium]|nr:SDR family oxidoreductase [Chloroflexota bacterium]